MKKILTLLMFAIVVSCSSNNDLTQEQRTYMEKCLSNNHGWMYMSETKDGQVVGRPCHGCMPTSKDHICTMPEYDQFLSKMESS